MTNLQFDKSTMHTGIVIPGRKATVDEKTGYVTETPGAIIDLEADTRGLKQVAQSLVDRGMAHITTEPATHTLAVVNAAQEAMPKDASAGTGTTPIADSVKQHLQNQHELAAQKDAAASQHQAQVQAQTTASPDGFPQRPEQPAAPSAPAPVDVSKQQPTPEEIAATAAAQN